MCLHDWIRKCSFKRNMPHSIDSGNLEMDAIGGDDNQHLTTDRKLNAALCLD